MNKPRLSRVIGLSLSALVAGLVGGCDLGMKPGAKSILEVFAGPEPIDAAKWSTDEYDADKRYRGTMLLANAPFAGEPLYIQLFMTNIKDVDPGVRAASVRGLGNHGESSHVPLIVERLTDTDPGVRLEAAHALQRLHNEVAVEPLLNAINPVKEPEVSVRIEAADALGQYPENRVVEQLMTALADDHLAVNRAAHGSLRTLTGQDFGIDRAKWFVWYTSNKNVYAARTVYTYPVFRRDMVWYEYLPFVPGPPNESVGIPAGMTPGTVE